VSAQCEMLLETSLPTADRECWRAATHLVPGTPLGPVSMCDECFAGWLVDNDGNEAGVVYLNDAAFIAFLERAASPPEPQ